MLREVLMWQPTSAFDEKKVLHLGNFGWTYWSNIGVKLYQYWVGETTPIANSPALVKQQTLIHFGFVTL
jgi:hypothetical protein